MSAQDVAKAVVSEGIAPHAAAGWARRVENRWVTDVAYTDPQVTFFDLASLTKSLCAVAWAKSGFALTDPLGKFLDEAFETPSEHVPLELFLAHRAGLVDHIPLYAPLLGGGHVSRREAIRSCANARRLDALGEPPAEGFPPIYSDPNYILAGQALARISNVDDPGEAIAQWVTRPLGVSSDLGTAAALSAHHAQWIDRVAPTETVEWRGGEVRGAVHDENAWALTGYGSSGHAGFFGNVQSVIQFGCAVLDAVCLHEGPFAGADMLPLIRRRPGGSLLAGFDSKSETGSSAGTLMGARAFGHLGFTGTSLWMDPESSIVTVLLTNRVCPSRNNLAIRAARPALNDLLFTCAGAA